MNIGKKELIISVVLILVFLIIGVNASVLATTIDVGDFVNRIKGDNNTTTNNTAIPQIPSNRTNNETQNSPATNNSINNANTNTPGKVPDTGLEDAPWLIIGICAISAVFAYKKIKEYRID